MLADSKASICKNQEYARKKEDESTQHLIQNINMYTVRSAAEKKKTQENGNGARS